MKKILLIFALVLLTACSTNNDSLVGTWKGKSPDDGILKFRKDGSVAILQADGTPALDANKMQHITYETIEEVTPHQLYLIIQSERMPFGIYKIENRKLIIRDAIEYHNTVGGFSMGVSRYEFPSNFNGTLRVFTRSSK